jgi:uncharacterized membrane protein (UPF0136 family)
MSLTEAVLILYCGILFNGAYFGWKAKSKISFIMGSCSGFLVVYGMFLIRTNAFAGYCFLSVISALLSVVFLIRFVKTSKFLPAGMLLGASLLVLALTISELL